MRNFGRSHRPRLIPDRLMIEPCGGTNHVIAVELEFTQKSIRRYDRIIREYLTKSVDLVWYTVRMIFGLFLENESLRKTCVALKEIGVYQKRFTNKHGFEKGAKVFSVDLVRSLLTNAAYIGMRPAEIEGEKQLIPAVWKPIISQQLFQKVQERLGLNKNRYKPETWKKCIRSR